MYIKLVKKNLSFFYLHTAHFLSADPKHLPDTKEGTKTTLPLSALQQNVAKVIRVGDSL